MGSKSKKPDKLARLAVRNPVAANPLLGKGGEHKNMAAERKRSRARARRALQQMRKQLRQSDRGEGGWQSGLNRVSALLQTVLPAAFINTSTCVTFAE